MLPAATVRRRQLLHTGPLLGVPLGAARLAGTPHDAIASEGRPESLDGQLTRLAALLRDRAASIHTLGQAEEAERTALRDLAAHEATLRRLVAVRLDVTERLAAGRDEVAALESALGHPSSTEIAAVHRRLAGLVDRLGEANVEIAHWQYQADAAARRAGSARSRAIESSRRLVRLQEEGERAAQDLVELFGVLGEWTAESRSAIEAFAREHADQLAAHLAVDDSASALPPWPPAPPPAYVPVRGPLVAPLISVGSPIVDAVRILADAVGPGGRSEWRAPVPGPITAGFGSSTPYFPAHWAVDIAARLYTPVRVAAAGRIAFAGLATPGEPRANHGMVVLVQHGPRLSTLYAHLDAGAFAPGERAGADVEAGHVIGHVGLTGYSTGPHLHFEARLDGRLIDPALLVPLDG